MAREKKEKPLSDKREKMAHQIAGKLVHLQQVWAERMSNLASKFSIRDQKRILVIGTVLMAAFCFSLVIGAFQHQTENIPTAMVPRLIIPRPDHRMDSLKPNELKSTGRRIPERADSLRQLKKENLK